MSLVYKGLPHGVGDCVGVGAVVGAGVGAGVVEPYFGA